MSGGEPSSIKQLRSERGRRLLINTSPSGCSCCLPRLFFEGEVSFLHTALYRKWRPADFSSVVGQDHITGVLRYEVAHGRRHTHTFSAARAGRERPPAQRYWAKAINCLSPVDGNPCGKCEACLAVAAGNATDIIEMDAASNNGVEYIRDIREEVNTPPRF